jgi:hypothetical protein
MGTRHLYCMDSHRSFICSVRGLTSANNMWQNPVEIFERGFSSLRYSMLPPSTDLANITCFLILSTVRYEKIRKYNWMRCDLIQYMAIGFSGPVLESNCEQKNLCSLQCRIGSMKGTESLDEYFF